jgi:hypothetical protein
MAVDVRDITLRQLLNAVQQQGSSGGRRVGQWDTEVGSPTSQYLYGVGGLFGTLGLEQDVISTRVTPRGLMSRLPAQNTNVIWPEFPYLVGFTNAEDGADESFDDQGVCDDGPVAGQLLGCIQTAQFGMLTYDTEAIDIGMVGQQVNRGQFTDLRLVGTVLDPLSNITPATADQNQRVMLQNDALSKMVAVGVAYQNKLLRLLYTGTPANNNTGGAYKEFWGLDNLIVHNHRDAHTQALCPTLDSLIVDYENANIGADGASALAFVNSVTWTYRMLKYRAERTGLNPARWAISMRQAAFWEAASVWACAYYTYRCQTAATDTGLGSAVGQLDVRDTVALRDDMRSNNYLLIDGERVEVTIDDGIVETANGSGCYKSNMYFVPLVVNGNLAATYIQFYDYSKAIDAARVFNFTSNEFWTDGGRFLWMRKIPRKRCIQLASEVQLRVVLRTPHLAAKILDVGYCPTLHEPDALPGDLNYVAPGGVGTRSGYGPSLFDNAGNPIVP